MAGPIWIHGEVAADGTLARVSTEAATLGRTLAEAAGTEVVGVVVAADPAAAATELARYLPRVLAVTEPALADGVAAAIVAQRIAGLAKAGEDATTPAVILAGAGPEGRDVAGAVGALLGLPLLANAVAVTWADDGPRVDQGIFGGKLVTTSAFAAGRGIVTLRPNVVAAEPAATPGVVEAADASGTLELPGVRVVDRVVEAGAAAPIEEARVIVAGGRGVGGPDGFALVEQLAEALGGVVGATRAAVDAGWIPYAQQIGQTGKIVKPQLYVALGISGAIQHKVGMQTAETIIAVNRDPDAPLAEFADLYVVGDLFEIGPAIVAELRSRGS